MALRTSADNAEDVAAGFRMLREPLPEHATEITCLIADLYAISSSLKTLEDLTGSHFYRHTFLVVRSDLELVRTSLKYTLEDIVDFFGNLDEVRRLDREAIYKRTWLDLCDFFRNESTDSLTTRLAKYRAFLDEVKDLTKECVSFHAVVLYTSLVTHCCWTVVSFLMPLLCPAFGTVSSPLWSSKRAAQLCVLEDLYWTNISHPTAIVLG